MAIAVVYGDFIGGRKIVAQAPTEAHLLMELEATGIQYDAIETLN